MTVYPPQATQAWGGVVSAVSAEVTRSPGETVATIATNTSLTQAQVYWALSILAGSQQVVLLPATDSEFLTLFGPQG